MIKKNFNKRVLILWVVALMTVFTLIIATSANALTDTIRPTILYISPVNDVSPSNNELDVGTHALITVMFSEDMNPATINKDTFTVIQRTTPKTGEASVDYRELALDGIITYADRKATFTSVDKFTPNQEYGNVFTVRIMPGVADLAGNSLVRDYVWSFTTGETQFYTGTTTTQKNQNSSSNLVNTASTDTIRPTILYISPVNDVSPANNELDVGTHALITVMFSEDMNPATINKDTFTVIQRTTPKTGEASVDYRELALDGIITYADRKATFTSVDKFTPNQEYGNVFTVRIMPGVADLAGNSLVRDYVWSFTTGETQFYTGTTTTQTNQNNSGALATVPTTSQQPVVATPIAGNQAATTSSFPWGWAIGGLFFLLLIAAMLFLILTSTSTSQKDRKIIRAKRTTSPFGDVHPVADIEGIGPKYSKGLQTMGINNTKQLWEANTAKVARIIGAPMGSVMSWQNMSELASVKDVGPQYAELLERSGVHTISQLKNYDTIELLNIVREKQDSLKINIQGNALGQATVGNWIAEARDHRFTESEGQRV